MYICCVCAHVHRGARTCTGYVRACVGIFRPHQSSADGRLGCGFNRTRRSRWTQEMLRRSIHRTGCVGYVDACDPRGAIHWAGRLWDTTRVLFSCGRGMWTDRGRTCGRFGTFESKMSFRHPSGYNFIKLILLLHHYFAFACLSPHWNTISSRVCLFMFGFVAPCTVPGTW